MFKLRHIAALHIDERTVLLNDALIHERLQWQQELLSTHTLKISLREHNRAEVLIDGLEQRPSIRMVQMRSAGMLIAAIAVDANIISTSQVV